MVSATATATATTVRVSGGKGGEVLTTDGPYADTKEARATQTPLEPLPVNGDERIALRSRATRERGQAHRRAPHLRASRDSSFSEF